MPTKEEMELISQYATKSLDVENVYVFSLTLCDNDIDRDFECFTKESLDALCELFKGKTGIFDHNMKSESQNARIFQTWVEKSNERKTKNAKPYYRLKAKAYMIRTKKNESLIAEIEGGIKKEVSIGCAVSKTVCSICGSDMKEEFCGHKKGKTYDGKLCFGILSSPVDAYEWSFVAVPSQRLAGVTKGFSQAERTVKSICLEGQRTITESQAKSLKQFVEHCKAEQKQLEFLKESVVSQIQKYATVSLPQSFSKSLLCGIEKMPAEELLKLRDELEKEFFVSFAPTPQLCARRNEQKNKTDNSVFRI